jgi:hypothetical protein
MSRDKNRIVIGIVLITVASLGLIFSLAPFAPWGYPVSRPGIICPMRGVWSGWQGPLTMDDAIRIAEDYLKSLNNEDLAIKEIMEFELNFYVVYYEKSTGIGAFEMLIDKPGTGGMMGYGYIRPEPGPNMMWNTKYGMHVGWVGGIGNRTITVDQAKEYAQRWLDTYLPGTIAKDVHPFYGYYTIHIERDGKIYGMLSVNAFTGQVWYHNWHGTYIQTKEMSEH